MDVRALARTVRAVELDLLFEDDDQHVRRRVLRNQGQAAADSSTRASTSSADRRIGGPRVG